MDELLFTIFLIPVIILILAVSRPRTTIVCKTLGEEYPIPGTRKKPRGKS